MKPLWIALVLLTTAIAAPVHAETPKVERPATLRAHIDDAVDRSRAISDLHAQIQDAFNEFGVQIMSPAFESQPDGAVVVPRARWLAAPAPPPDGSRTGS